jgi:hypothetical protein
MNRYAEYIKAIIDDPRRHPEYAEIPVWMLHDLVTYLKTGVPPSSGFVSAVLENDLVKACGNADDHSLEVLPTIAKLMFNHMPGDSWGSKGAVESYTP